MRVACPSCQAAYKIDDQRVPAAGLNVRCPKCKTVFPIKIAAPAAVAAAVPLPVPAGAPPVARPPPLSAATPAPGLSSVPLPAPAAEPFPVAPPADGGAIPLPLPAAAAAAPFAPPIPQAFPPAPAPGPVAPPAPPLDFGEVSFDNVAPPTSPFESLAEPPAESDNPFAIPPSDDPFFAPPPPAPPVVVPPPAPPIPPPVISAPVPPSVPGLGGLGSAESQELEALFGESSESKGSQLRPPPGPAFGEQYKVRRRSGKIFGPFGDAQVVEMLGKGELLGNEDVSSDGGASWAPIGSVPGFAEAMRALMEGPAEVPEALAQGGSAAGPAGAPFVSRMAQSRIVSDRAAGWRLQFRPKVLLAAAGALLLLILAAGAGAGFTRHGWFFYKTLRGRSTGRPAARALAELRAALASDHFDGARRAVELAEQAFRLDADDPEAKGLYVQATAALARHGGATAALISRAGTQAQQLAASDPGEPDTVKARVALDLATGTRTAPEGLRALEKLAQKPSAADEEALFLLGQAAAARADWPIAARWYSALQARSPGSARATHGLATAAAARGDVPGARGLFEKALTQDPRHLLSALELAALLDRGGDAAAAETVLLSALGPGAAGLSSDERARGRILLAGLLARRPGTDGRSRLREAQSSFEDAVAEAPAYLPARLAYGRFLLRRGAADRALSVLQPVAQASGSEPEFAALYGPALAASGRILDAINALDPVLAKVPGNAPLLVARGFVAEQGGKRDDARAMYERAAAADKSDWESHLALGRMALRSGDLGRAETELKLAAERGPQAPEPRVGLGDWKLSRGDLAGAEAELREALKLDPDHATGHLGLARVFTARGDDAAARPALEKALQLDPRLAAAQLAMGELLWRAKDLENAKKAFQNAVALGPQDAVARARLGAVELEAGQLDAAVNDLLAASNLDLALADVHFWLGRALLAKGEVSQAVDHLKRACELKPDSVTYHLHYGMAQERANAIAEAADEYQLAIAKDPKLVDGYERLGQLLASQNRCEEAVPQFEKALKAAPGAQRIRIAMGDCRQKMRKFAEAIVIYKEVLKADPSQVGLYYKIGRAVHEIGGAGQAFPWYDRAGREDAANPMPHYYLGFYFKDRRQKAKAAQEFKAYLQAKPDADDRKDIEREIEDLGG